MAKGSGFFKGEKKKQKKTKNAGFGSISSEETPTYTMPEVIPNKKKNNW